MSVPNDLILYHYPYSPVARRIVWYLAFRGIEYAQCVRTSLSSHVSPSLNIAILTDPTTDNAPP